MALAPTPYPTSLWVVRVYPIATKGGTRELEGWGLQAFNMQFLSAGTHWAWGIAVNNSFPWTTINNTVMNICEQLLFSKEPLQAERKTTLEVQVTPYWVTPETLQSQSTPGCPTGRKSLCNH